MMIKFKHACLAAVGAWTLLGILEIWDVIDLSGRLFATFGLLTLSAIISLWMKDR